MLIHFLCNEAVLSNFPPFLISVSLRCWLSLNIYQNRSCTTVVLQQLLYFLERFIGIIATVVQVRAKLPHPNPFHLVCKSQFLPLFFIISRYCSGRNIVSCFLSFFAILPKSRPLSRWKRPTSGNSSSITLKYPLRVRYW